MKIREATPADLDTIARLIRALADYERLAQEVKMDESELGGYLFGERRYPSWLPVAQELVEAQRSRTESSGIPVPPRTSKGAAILAPKQAAELLRDQIERSWLRVPSHGPHRGRNNAGGHSLQEVDQIEIRTE